MGKRAKVAFDVILGLVLDFSIFGDEIQGLVLFEYLEAHFVSIALLKGMTVCIFYFYKLAYLYLLVCDLVIEEAQEFRSVLVSLLNRLVLLRPIFQLFLQLKYLHL
jgi:hypothetical protein